MSTFIIARKFSTSGALRAMIKSPVQVFGVEGRYASALYSAAVKSKNLEAVDKDMKLIQQTLKTDRRFREFVLDPTFKRQIKTQAFQQALTKLKCSDLTKNMFGCMGDNGRLKLTNHVVQTYTRIMSAHNGEVDCVVTTAKALDAASQKELQTALQGFLKPNEKIVLTMKVDPSLIGGMMVSIADKFVDMSMSTKIRTYENVIQQAI